MTDSLTIIITGGTGCVGFAITKALLNQHHSSSSSSSTSTSTTPSISIHILDIAIPSPTAPNFLPNVTKYHKVDITDAATINSLFSTLKPNIIIHTASIIPSAARKQQISNTRLWQVNVEGTRNVLAAAEKQNAIIDDNNNNNNSSNKNSAVQAFVYTSSCDAVKPDSWMDFVNASEEQTAHLLDADRWDGEYARTKAAAEKLVLSSQRTIKTCAIRTHAVVGTHDRNLFPLVATSPRRVSLGSGKNLYDFSSADNVAAAHLLAIDNLRFNREPSANRRAFFVSDGNPLPFRQFQEMVWREVDRTEKKSYGWYLAIPVWLFASVLRLAGLFTKTDISPHDVGDAVATRYFDISEAKKVLGYEPKKSLQESVADAYQSWSQKT